MSDTKELMTFAGALELFAVLKCMRDDLPDGQWQELKESIQELTTTEGKKTSEWSDETKVEFIAIIEEIEEFRSPVQGNTINPDTSGQFTRSLSIQAR